MTWAQSIVLGIIQGLTEFLPISSSAHLRLVKGTMASRVEALVVPAAA